MSHTSIPVVCLPAETKRRTYVTPHGNYKSSPRGIVVVFSHFFFFNLITHSTSAYASLCRQVTFVMETNETVVEIVDGPYRKPLLH